jgi:hypothetical protein
VLQVGPKGENIQIFFYVAVLDFSFGDPIY